MSIITVKRLPTDTSQASTIQAASSEKSQATAQARVSQESVLLMPPGGVIAYGGIQAPDGFLLCDGAKYAIEDYPQLAEVLGVRFGGTTTEFNVPDLRGRVIVAPDGNLKYQAGGRITADNEVSEYGGAQTHQLTSGQMPIHSHDTIVGDPGVVTDITYGEINNVVNTGSTTGVTRNLTETRQTAPNTGTAGSGEAHPNLQPYLVLNYIIKY